MLRAALSRVDLGRDAVIVTTDHGHVARGGHGPEREVSRVALVRLVGAQPIDDHQHDPPGEPRRIRRVEPRRDRGERRLQRELAVPPDGPDRQRDRRGDRYRARADRYQVPQS